MDGNVARDEQGRVVGGSVLNPQGKNGHLEGWQRYGDRLQKWFALPAGEIRALVNDPVRFDALSSIDATCVLQITKTLEGSHREREAALDRMESKPKQTIAGDPGNPLPLSGGFTLTFGTDGNEEGG